MDLSDEMQHQSKALADPSRFKLFRHIAESSTPATVAELTKLLGFNHNAIRQHLAVLVDAGLIAEADEVRTTRGRPRKQYTVRADALSAFGSISGSYEQLAEMLLKLVGSDLSPYEVGFESGANRPADPTPDLASAQEALSRRLNDDGFAPTTTRSGATKLNHCPFADVASQDPGVVCELHRGLIDGYLTQSQQALTSELTLRAPHRGGCQVTLTSAE